MRSTLTILIMLALPVLTFAQAPDTLWTRTFGGSLPDKCYSVLQTPDGGYILGGYTRSYGAGLSDSWLIQTNANGDYLWSNTFGGSNTDICRSVQQTLDGGYILGGYTNSFGTGFSGFRMMKTDNLGDSLWSRTFGGADYEKCHSIQQSTDSGYILGGTTESFGAGGVDFWLVKTNASGDTLWTRTFGGSSDDHCYSIQQTTDGGYILGGYTESYGAGSADFWLVKTDAGGTEEWSYTYGGSGGEECNSVQQTEDGGYVLGGMTESYGEGGYDFWLVKTDANGDTLWTRTFGGSEGEGCYSVRQTADGGYILGGYTESFGAGSSDLWVVKTEANGDSLWNRTFGGSEWDACYSVQQTLDGGYILGGYTQSYGAGIGDFWLVKMGPERPYHVTVYPDTNTDNPVIRWVAPYECDYLIYSTTNPNHDGSPPGPDWTPEVTLPSVPAGPAEWEDVDALDESYRNYVVVTSCP